MSRAKRLMFIIVPLVLLVALSFRIWTPVQRTVQVQSSELSGYWYMGTMTGQDCDLEIRPDGQLRVRHGGCFSTEPWVTSTWRLGNDRVEIQDPALRARFGDSLLPARYKDQVILIPAIHGDLIRSRKFAVDACFWRNLMGKDGLELSKVSKDFGR